MGVVIITTLVFGLITPPYGLSLLVASKYVGVGFGRAVVRSLPLYVVFFLTIAFVVLFPDVVLWLPKQLLPESVGCFKSPTRRRLHLSASEPIERAFDAMNSTADLRLPFAVRPLTPRLGAEISGVDLARRHVRRSLPRASTQAFLRYQVLLFPPQDVPPGGQVAFARQFGEVQIHVMNQYHADGFPELYRLSNLDENGKPNGRHPDKGTLAWHTDGSWSRVTGQATIIYGEVMPETGGETHFCDMYGAYERLDAAWKARIADLRAVHNLDFSRTRRHGEDPMTEEQKREQAAGRPADRAHASGNRPQVHLPGRPRRVHRRHALRRRTRADRGAERARRPSGPDLRAPLDSRGELIVWDNRCVMHRATGYDPRRRRRVVRRCTVLGEVPVGVAAA